MTDFKAPPPPGGFEAPAQEAQAPVVKTPEMAQPQADPQPVPPSDPQEEAAPAAPVVNEQPAEASSQPSSQPAEASAPQAESTPEVKESKKDVALKKFQVLKENVMTKFNALPGNKKQVILFAGMFFIGLLMGIIMFGGGGEQPVSTSVSTGLDGVVTNPDIKEKLKRCGQAEASSACVLYVMNTSTYERLAEDFFEVAVFMTQRKKQEIRMANVRYLARRIPPGYFAQIKIPAYK